MSLLSGILAVVGIVGGILTGGVLGAVMIATSALSGLASNGVIGGSIGKFLNSGLGAGLMAAVTLGSAAYNMLPAAVGAVGEGEAAASLDSITQTVSGSVSDTVGADTQAIINSSQDASLMTDGLPVADVKAVNAAASAATPGGDMTGVTQEAVQGNASNVAASQTNADLAATGSGGQSGQSIANPADIQTAGGSYADRVLQQTGAATGPGEENAGTAAEGGGPAADQSAVASQNSPQTAQPAEANNGNATEEAGAPGTSDSPTTNQPAPGMLAKVENWANTNPMMATGAAMVGGNLLSGVANGIAQNQMLNKQLAAANWANTQWQNGNGVPQLQAAAAQPITVPQGYLSRANAVANLMQGNTSQNGPVSGVQPVGTTGNASSGSVPVSALPGAGTLTQPMAPAGLQGTTPSAVVPRGGVA